MRSRHEAFNEQDWSCVSLQAPLGTVILARKLPARPARCTRSGALSDWISRRFAPSNPPDSAAKRSRSRRGL